MRTSVTWVLSAIFGFGFVAQNTLANEKVGRPDDSLRVYKVNKEVKDFPEKEDFSTPEAAYATINRLSASGDQAFWRRVSVKRLAERMPTTQAKRKISKQAAYGWLNAQILEVRIFRDIYAGVIAKIPHPWKSIIDYRSLEFENGQWLNAGNDVFGDVEEARRKFSIICGRYAERPTRPRMDNPQAYLRPFVEFLESNAEEPKAFVMKALAKHKVIIMGEIHHRPRYWAFNSSLVADPDFPKYAGTIYMELPSNDQGLIDEFLASEPCDTMLVIRMLRDMLWMGWPDQPMLNFFVRVWNTNRALQPNQRLRIVLVDMQRPWEKIQNRNDWRQHDVDRDKYMAENILEDIRKHPAERRNRLFIVGVGHAGLNLQFHGGEPLKTAGWYLRERLGPDNVYVIFPHRCVMTNMGRVDGRLCLGLFDSAFAALGNKSMAFTLEKGPFGEQPYDADPENPVWCNYRDGFNAYLYLGPLEDEIFSPLIPGFYTDKFVKELDRRYRIMFKKSLVEGCRLERLDGKSFAGWMNGSWGKPRKWQNKLGPMDAWKYGDNWERDVRERKHKYAFEHPQVITAAAQRLFDAIQKADYDRHASGSDWPNFLPDTVDYMVHHHFDSWVKWVCSTFKDDPIKSVELGEVFKNDQGLPAIPYNVTLRDGRQLKGVLPFKYLPRQDCWMGIEGIDWHIQYGDSSEGDSQSKAEPPETVAEPEPVATLRTYPNNPAQRNVMMAQTR